MLLAEREASLLAHAAREAAAAGEGQVVVVIVGASHVPGMQWQWTNGVWRGNPAAALPAQGRRELGAPSFSAARRAALRAAEKERRRRDRSAALTKGSDTRAAVQRALAESIFQLASAYQLPASGDMAECIGQLPTSQFPTYARTLSHFGSLPMLLATLSESQMASVFGGRAAQRIFGLLEPFRATRAFYAGGSGDLASLHAAMKSAYGGAMDEVSASMASVNPEVAGFLKCIERGTIKARVALRQRSINLAQNKSPLDKPAPRSI